MKTYIYAFFLLLSSFVNAQQNEAYWVNLEIDFLKANAYGSIYSKLFPQQIEVYFRVEVFFIDRRSGRRIADTWRAFTNKDEGVDFYASHKTQSLNRNSIKSPILTAGPFCNIDPSNIDVEVLFTAWEYDDTPDLSNRRWSQTALDRSPIRGTSLLNAQKKTYKLENYLNSNLNLNGVGVNQQRNRYHHYAIDFKLTQSSCSPSLRTTKNNGKKSISEFCFVDKVHLSLGCIKSENQTFIYRDYRSVEEGKEGWENVGHLNTLDASTLWGYSTEGTDYKKNILIGKSIQKYCGQWTWQQKWITIYKPITADVEYKPACKGYDNGKIVLTNIQGGKPRYEYILSRGGSIIRRSNGNSNQVVFEKIKHSNTSYEVKVESVLSGCGFRHIGKIGEVPVIEPQVEIIPPCAEKDNGIVRVKNCTDFTNLSLASSRKINNNLGATDTCDIQTKLPSGTYILKSTDINDCPYDTKIKIERKPPLEIVFTPDRVICPKDTLVLGVNKPLAAYSWTRVCPPSLTYTTPTIELKNGEGGPWLFSARDAFNCETQNEVYIADWQLSNAENLRMSEVLQIGATRYKSNWLSDFSDMEHDSEEALLRKVNANPYMTGLSGIYKPSKIFDWRDIREQTTPRVDLREDGIMKDVARFDWDNIAFESQVKNWVPNNSITSYNGYNFEIENKDILNRYSAALYGYTGKLATAVANNTQYKEIGYENFEEYRSGGSRHMLNNTTGNIDIVNKKLKTYQKTKRGDILMADDKYIWLDVDYDEVKVNFDQGNGKVKAMISGQHIRTDGREAEKFAARQALFSFKPSPCGSKTLLEWDTDNSPLPFLEWTTCNRQWIGEALLFKQFKVDRHPLGNVSYTHKDAHTGRMSAKISGQIYQPQYGLYLRKGKYVLSAWVKVAADIDKSPEARLEYVKEQGIGLKVIVPKGGTAVYGYPKGEIIEGWQKMDVSFTILESGSHIYLTSNPKTPYYIDDIRISPFGATMQTFVYDNTNYRHRATLDENNYATIYRYDDQGNLFLVQKETVQGIQTIQMTDSYINENK